MVTCAKCDTKLGLFSLKHDYEDDKGNAIKYCNDCHKKAEEKERTRLEKKEEEERKRLEKEQIDMNKKALQEQTEVKKQSLSMIEKYIRNITDSERLSMLKAMSSGQFNLDLAIQNLQAAVKTGKFGRTFGFVGVEGYDPVADLPSNEQMLNELNNFRNELFHVCPIITEKGIKITTAEYYNWFGEVIAYLENQARQSSKTDFDNKRVEKTDNQLYCSSCGNIIKKNSKFCKHCGAKQ